MFLFCCDSSSGVGYITWLSQRQNFTVEFILTSLITIRFVYAISIDTSYEKQIVFGICGKSLASLPAFTHSFS